MINYNSIIIAYFGRIQKEKGIELIIDALEKLCDYDWRFLIDKFDKYKNEFSKIIYDKIESSPISNRVIFFDANHYEISKYMNASDIFTLSPHLLPLDLKNNMVGLFRRLWHAEI